jgi:hypothetical protein
VVWARVVEIFLETGSHFVTHADWGCKDGDHQAWIVAEVDSKDEARFTLPPTFRTQAKIVQLNKLVMAENNVKSNLGGEMRQDMKPRRAQVGLRH